MATEIKFFTVSEAAKELGVTSGRVRQVLVDKDIQCADSIGMRHGWAWILTSEDIGKLRKYILRKT